MAEETLPDLINNITLQWANERVAKAKKILRDNGIDESKNLLPQSIIADQTITSNSIRIDFYASDYYIFIDQGVTGIGGGKKPLKPTTGKYKFKTLGVSKSMQMSIQNWVARKGIQVRKSKEESGKLVIKRSYGVAYAIAKSIKRTGIGKTMFWSDTFNEKAYQDLADRIAKKLGGDFTIQLRGL